MFAPGAVHIFYKERHTEYLATNQMHLKILEILTVKMLVTSSYKGFLSICLLLSIAYIYHKQQYFKIVSQELYSYAPVFTSLYSIFGE